MPSPAVGAPERRRESERVGPRAERTTGWRPDGLHPADERDHDPDYWTVTTPFMFIAACGMQM